MRHPFRLLPALLALLVPALVAGTATPANAAGGTVKIVSANLGSGPSDVARTQVNNMGAQVATFQEICASEFFRWRNEYGWEGQFSRMTEAHENDRNRCAGQEKGSAVLHHPALSSTVHRLSLPTGSGPGWVSGKEFNLLCLDIAGIITDDLYVCTTHLWAGDDRMTGAGENDAVRRAQINKAMDWLGPWSSWARRVIFTGGLNTGPGSSTLDPVYGKYQEATPGDCRCGTDTVDGRKIDYIFGDKPLGGQATSLSLVANGLGDGHKVLRGKITFP